MASSRRVYLEGYLNRKARLLQNTTTNFIVSGIKQNSILLPEGTVIELTGEIYLDPGTDGLGREILVANAAAFVAEPVTGETYNIVVPLQWFTLLP